MLTEIIAQPRQRLSLLQPCSTPLHNGDQASSDDLAYESPEEATSSLEATPIPGSGVWCLSIKLNSEAPGLLRQRQISRPVELTRLLKKSHPLFVPLGRTWVAKEITSELMERVLGVTSADLSLSCP